MTYYDYYCYYSILGTSDIHGQCISEQDALVHFEDSPSEIPEHITTSPSGVAIVAWTLTKDVHKLYERMAMTSSGHVIILFLINNAESGPVIRKLSSAIRIEQINCDENQLKDTFISRDIRYVHFVFDSDTHVTMDGMTSLVTGRLFECHTAILQGFSNNIRNRRHGHIFFHFGSSQYVRYNSAIMDYKRDVMEVGRSCSVTFSHHCGHQVYIKLLEMILRTYKGLYKFTYYFVV
jgi:hypothetical protein